MRRPASRRWRARSSCGSRPTLNHCAPRSTAPRCCWAWDCDADHLREALDRAVTLRWIHWGGAGVDGLPFHDLIANDVVLTHARGIFDRAMAEFALGLILAFAKRLPETLKSQAERRWDHRFNERIDDKHVLVVGVG